MQLVARMNHTRNEIKCGDFCVCFFKQCIINRQEHYSFRATSCTLRSTINPRTERYLTLFRHFRFRATSCTLRSTTKPRTERYLTLFRYFRLCNKLHATIHDQPTHGTLFNPFGHFRFRATSCTLRSTISCIKMHATIHDFVQQVARYDSQFRATSYTLRGLFLI